VKLTQSKVALFCERAEGQVNTTEQARTFRLQPPEFNFSTSNASAVPLASTVRNSAQEHNAALLALVFQLHSKLEGDDSGEELPEAPPSGALPEVCLLLCNNADSPLSRFRTLATTSTITTRTTMLL